MFRGERCMRRHSATLICTAALATAVLAPVPAPADDWRIVGRNTAVVRSGPAFTTDLKAARIDFDSFEFRGFLLGDGTWQVSSPVTHQRLVCATYEVGIRFGVGNPGCNDVRWLSDPMFIGSRRQCNAATVIHVGGETTPRLGDQLPSVTCVERVLRCTGSCG